MSLSVFSPPAARGVRTGGIRAADADTGIIINQPSLMRSQAEIHGSLSLRQPGFGPRRVITAVGYAMRRAEQNCLRTLVCSSAPRATQSQQVVDFCYLFPITDINDCITLHEKAESAGVRGPACVTE